MSGKLGFGAWKEPDETCRSTHYCRA